MEETSQSHQNYEELRRILGEYELIVDSALLAIARSRDYQEQKNTQVSKRYLLSKISLLCCPIVKIL